MSVEFDFEDLAQRLVIRRKRDGRCVYDPIAKRELIQACMQPGVSVTKAARQCGVNANQLSTWIRVQQQASSPASAAPGEVIATAPATFVPVQIQQPPRTLARQDALLDLTARLPNGVAVDLRACDLEQAHRLIEALGRLRCSASTNG